LPTARVRWPGHCSTGLAHTTSAKVSRNLQAIRDGAGRGRGDRGGLNDPLLAAQGTGACGCGRAGHSRAVAGAARQIKGLKANRFAIIGAARSTNLGSARPRHPKWRKSPTKAQMGQHLPNSDGRATFAVASALEVRRQMSTGATSGSGSNSRRPSSVS
jgi:hypothetical protein